MNQLPDTAGGVDAPPEPTANVRWAVRDGVELLGPVLDSGLSAPTFLLRRHDGQVVQVSELINIVLEELCPERTLAEVAATVSARYQRRLTSDGLSHLLTGTLSRVGLVSPTDAKPVVAEERNLPRATPILSLTLRGTLLPAAATRRVASVLRGLYWPPVVVAALLGWLALDVLVVLSAGRAGLADAITQLLSAPALVLALYAAMTLASLIHETGHAAASRYGGAVPGRIGVGVYIIYVAFYTDVTDSYRLSRTARLRTDLGGLYFNVLTVIGLAAAYLATGNGFFLLMVVLLQIEMAQQLLPIVRFDGYYILADLTGVPNLFARVRPVLLSLRPRRFRGSQASDLKPVARRLVRAWVLIVVPFLALSLGWLFWNIPVIISQTLWAARTQYNQVITSAQTGDVSRLLLSAISIPLLMLPILGIGILLWRLGRTLVRWIWHLPVAST